MNSTWLYHLIGNVKSMGLNDYLDIIIVAFLVYYLTKLVKETRAVQLLKGMAALGLIYLVAAVAELQTLQFIMNKFGLSSNSFIICNIVIIFN